jgi:hypothetical protein
MVFVGFNPFNGDEHPARHDKPPALSHEIKGLPAEDLPLQEMHPGGPIFRSFFPSCRGKQMTKPRRIPLEVKITASFQKPCYGMVGNADTLHRHR